jgi:hypothetical protein
MHIQGLALTYWRVSGSAGSYNGQPPDFPASQRAASRPAGSRAPQIGRGRQKPCISVGSAVIHFQISQSPLRACALLGPLVFLRSTIGRPAAMRGGFAADFRGAGVMRIDARRGRFDAIARRCETDSFERTSFSRFRQGTGSASRGFGDSGDIARKPLSSKGLSIPQIPQTGQNGLGILGMKK